VGCRPSPIVPRTSTLAYCGPGAKTIKICDFEEPGRISLYDATLPAEAVDVGQHARFQEVAFQIYNDKKYRVQAAQHNVRGGRGGRDGRIADQCPLSSLKSIQYWTHRLPPAGAGWRFHATPTQTLYDGFKIMAIDDSYASTQTLERRFWKIAVSLRCTFYPVAVSNPRALTVWLVCTIFGP
jgi:hypothetical protein